MEQELFSFTAASLDGVPKSAPIVPPAPARRCSIMGGAERQRRGSKVDSMGKCTILL